jgi:hypothetical protein
MSVVSHRLLLLYMFAYLVGQWIGLTILWVAL